MTANWVSGFAIKTEIILAGRRARGVGFEFEFKHFKIAVLISGPAPKSMSPVLGANRFSNRAKLARELFRPPKFSASSKLRANPPFPSQIKFAARKQVPCQPERNPRKQVPCQAQGPTLRTQRPAPVERA